jgi:hypothetical protein
MYKCAFCNEDVSHRMQRVVVETRKREYSGGFFGWEIVRELPACSSCAPACAIALPSKFVHPIRPRKPPREVEERRAA